MANRYSSRKLGEALMNMNKKMTGQPCRRRREAGMSLLETVIAMGVLIVATVGVMTITTVAMVTTEGQGHLAARAAEYAQDKMEQLLSLAYCDSTTNTTVFPSSNTGGTGMGAATPCPPGAGTYGSADPSAPVNGYVDYLDRSGNQLTITGGTEPLDWYYIRLWQISTPTGTTNLKQITVTAKVRNAVVSRGAAPQATVVSLKTYPF